VGEALAKAFKAADLAKALVEIGHFPFPSMMAVMGSERSAAPWRVLVAVCVLAGVMAPVGSVASHSPRDNKCYKLNDDERNLARRIKQARRRNGLRAMHRDPELSKVARTNSKKMARNGVLAHTGMTILQRRVTREVVLGEAVVAAGSTKRMMKLLMGSPPHRALILGSFRHYGVGIKGGGGGKWGTIVFSGRRNPGTTLDMPDC
jgi:uncharacterized protein YkwD